MTRRRHILNPVAPYQITARTVNKAWFPLSMDVMWGIFSNYLHFLHHAFGVEIYSFVLMSNHYHLLMSCPRGNLSEAMNYLQREVSRQINRSAGRINQSFGGPYEPSLITDNDAMLNVYKYIYRNPVDAGITRRVENYKYSTLHGLLGRSHLLIPIKSDEILFSDLEHRLFWLNEPFPRQSMREEIRKALRHSRFQWVKDREKERRTS